MFKYCINCVNVIDSSDTIFLNLPELDHGGKGT